MEKKYCPHCGKELILDYDIIDDDYTNPRYYYRCDCEKSNKGINSEEIQNTNNMEKVTINGKEYQIDIDKCKEQGLLIEEKSYPKDWNEFISLKNILCTWQYVGFANKSGVTNNIEENNAFVALGKLIQLRDWWWDNMCDGWRPNVNNDGVYYSKLKNGKIVGCAKIYSNHILRFPTEEISIKFCQTYKDLIEEAKMFL